MLMKYVFEKKQKNGNIIWVLPGFARSGITLSNECPHDPPPFHADCQLVLATLLAALIPGGQGWETIAMIWLIYNISKNIFPLWLIKNCMYVLELGGVYGWETQFSYLYKWCIGSFAQVHNGPTICYLQQRKVHSSCTCGL